MIGTNGSARYSYNDWVVNKPAQVPSLALSLSLSLTHTHTHTYTYTHTHTHTGGESRHEVTFDEMVTSQGYLAHKKVRPPRTLKEDYA